MRLSKRSILLGLLFFTCGVTAYSGTVAYWKFDEKIEEGIQSTPPSDALKLGEAISRSLPKESDDVPNKPSGNKHSASFENSACGLSVESQPSLNFGEGAAFTIEFWLKPRAYTSTELDEDISTLIQKREVIDSTRTSGYQINLLPEGKIGMRLEGKSEGGKTIISRTKIPLNEWSHIAFIRETDGKISLYINGEFDGGAVGPKFAGSVENEGPLVIGHHRYIKSKRFYYDGLIDEIRISNEAVDVSKLLCK